MSRERPSLFPTRFNHYALSLGLLVGLGLFGSEPFARAAEEKSDKPKAKDPLAGRAIRYITLKEAIAIALESGNRDSKAVKPLSNLLGAPTGLIDKGPIPYVDDTSPAKPGDSIRAFAFDLKTTSTNIKRAPAKFDERSEERIEEQPTWILIARLRTDQPRLEFERDVNRLLLNVETAYWILYEQYFALYSVEQAIRQSFPIWELVKEKYDIGTATIPELAQVRAVLENFRSQRLKELAKVQEAERQFRDVLGLPAEDGKHLVPADAPTTAACELDYTRAVKEALANRPELRIASRAISRFDSCWSVSAIRNFLSKPRSWDWPGRM